MLTRFSNNFLSSLKKLSPFTNSDKLINGVNAQHQPASNPAFLSKMNWKPGDIIMDRYRVEDIMSGSMGHVFICEHLGWGVKMAIKSPRPEVLADREGMKRILAEADAWIRMGMHPNIATCYYVLALEKIPHLFIEFVDGGSLGDWIQSGRCKDLRTTISLAMQFCHGMEYTHSKGIIHRDIKPQNVLITKGALLKITDFGILLNRAEIAKGGKSTAPISPTPTDGTNNTEATIGFRGTPSYASPEQLRNAHQVDQRTDIFSFGLCLWLMVCGKKPFVRNDIKQPIPEPTAKDSETKLPPILVELLKKSVAYDPQERYHDFADLRTDLNTAYTNLFHVPCPYAELSDIDLRADSLNNHAVSLFELGKSKEAAASLNQTLEINDVLPEALHNMILLRWRQTPRQAGRILRQIEAVKKRLPNLNILDPLAEEVKKDMRRQASKDNSIRENYPEFRLCIPPKSLEVFRDAQLHQTIRRSISSHLKNGRMAECHKVLLTSWQNNGYKKDIVFTRAYEKLLDNAPKLEVVGGQRLKTIKGYGSPVTCLACIPGSRKIVSASLDGRVILRDFGAKKKVNVLGQHNGPVRALSVSPNGKYLAVGSENGSISLWTIKGGKQNIIKSHQGAIWSLAFSPDSKKIATGSRGVINVHSLTNIDKPKIYHQRESTVRTLTFFNNAYDMVSGSDKGELNFFEEDTNEPVKIIKAHTLPLVAISANGSKNRFVSASADGNVKLWERHTGRSLKIIKAHDEAITSCFLLNDNKNIISGCEDDILKLWNSDSGECIFTLDGRGDGICSLAQGPHPHYFLAGMRDGAILLIMVIYRLDFD